MAGEAENAAEKESSGGKSPILLVIVAAVVSLLVGGAGSYFFLKSNTEASAEVVEDEPAEEARPRGADYAERLYSLEPFVVNVTGDGYSRYLKIKLDFETNEVAVKEELAARLPQVRDAVIVLLSSKRLSEITSFEGKALLKEDIRMRINDVIESGKIESVLFTEFVVQ